MSVYKEHPLIPDKEPTKTEQPASAEPGAPPLQNEQPASAEPGAETPPAPAGDTMAEDAGPAEASPSEPHRTPAMPASDQAPSRTVASDAEPEDRLEAAADPLPPKIWENDRWAVTTLGLESLTSYYPIDASTLLRVEAGTENVSSWALHLARKSWIGDIDPMLEALKNALSIHHPDQTTIDMAATAREARRIWEYSRPSARDLDADGLGHDYLEDAEARLAAYAARRRSQAPAALADWTDKFPPEHRDVLRQHGMDPEDHPAAHEYDRRLIELAQSGIAGGELARRAEIVFFNFFGDTEPDDYDDYPPELDFLTNDDGD